MVQKKKMAVWSWGSPFHLNHGKWSSKILEVRNEELSGSCDEHTAGLLFRVAEELSMPTMPTVLTRHLAPDRGA